MPSHQSGRTSSTRSALVVPTALGRYLSDPDREKANRAMQAMMKMQKIVIADLDKAYAG